MKRKLAAFLRRASDYFAELSRTLESRAISIEFGHGVFASLFRPESMPVDQLSIFPAVNLAAGAKFLATDKKMFPRVVKGYFRKRKSRQAIDTVLRRIARKPGEFIAPDSKPNTEYEEILSAQDAVK